MVRCAPGPGVLWIFLVQLARVFGATEARGRSWNDTTGEAETMTGSAPSVTPAPPIATGNRGLEYAESCQAALFDWTSSRDSYGSEYGNISTSIFSSAITQHAIQGGGLEATSLTTLCDGYPRAVGTVITSSSTTITTTYAWTNSNPTLVQASYPTPVPCSLSNDECKLLYSSWTSAYYEQTIKDAMRAPPCETFRPTPSYSTNAAGEDCDSCLVVGHKIRLLYWPLLAEPDSVDMCNSSVSANTLSGPVTGEGPNTIVTEGVTLTSPTVAVSISGLSRADKCGVHVPNTIIPVLTEDVTSVEGARAAFTHRPFNFANLNYRCQGDPDAIFLQTAGRDDCYQAVPASDYFYGYANAAGAQWYMSNAFENRTIWDNYQPQVLVPATLTDAIHSLWGKDCHVHPDGVWDPPIALEHVSSVPLPQRGPGAPTEYFTPTLAGAQPSMPIAYQPEETKFTAIAQEGPRGDVAGPSNPAEDDGPKKTAHATHGGGNSGGGVEVVHTTIITQAGNAADVGSGVDGAQHENGSDHGGQDGSASDDESDESHVGKQDVSGASSDHQGDSGTDRSASGTHDDANSRGSGGGSSSHGSDGSSDKDGGSTSHGGSGSSGGSSSHESDGSSDQSGSNYSDSAGNGGDNAESKDSSMRDEPSGDDGPGADYNSREEGNPRHHGGSSESPDLSSNDDSGESNDFSEDNDSGEDNDSSEDHNSSEDNDSSEDQGSDVHSSSRNHELPGSDSDSNAADGTASDARGNEASQTNAQDESSTSDQDANDSDGGHASTSSSTLPGSRGSAQNAEATPSSSASAAGNLTVGPWESLWLFAILVGAIL